jgi:hypothetical protein
MIQILFCRSNKLDIRNQIKNKDKIDFQRVYYLQINKSTNQQINKYPNVHKQFPLSSPGPEAI